MNQIIPFLLVFILFACSSAEKKEDTTTSVQTGAVAQPNDQLIAHEASIVKLETFDGNRALESETAFFVAPDVLVCRLSLLSGCNRAQVTSPGETSAQNVTGFVAVDRINNLVLLQVENALKTPIPLLTEIVPISAKTACPGQRKGAVIPIHTGKVLSYGNVEGTKRYRVSNAFRSKMYGSPVFVSTGHCIGLGYSEVVDYETQSFLIPAQFVQTLLNKQGQAEPLENLNTQASKQISEANSRIKGLLIRTDLGDIRIRLFNETPEYRDNFIRLVNENYFDSLLVHRVIKGFCIQSGAADTRYATKDDVVGWKGPGYTLPAHIVSGFFHRRGMIGSPRKPDRGNSKMRSDGSQFYIVTGRRYTDNELNDIEKENNIRFTATQRQVYKTIGGAPHIDGSYTIFGEVVSGMEIADQIAQADTDTEYRPLKDIRVREIIIQK